MQHTMAEIDYKYSVFECHERMRWNSKVSDNSCICLLFLISNFYTNYIMIFNKNLIKDHRMNSAICLSCKSLDIINTCLFYL